MTVKRKEEPEVDSTLEETPEEEEATGEETSTADEPKKNFTQAEIDAIVGREKKKAAEKAREEAREAVRAELEAEREAEAKKAKTQQLKDQAKFQELAEQREGEIAELTSRTETLRGELDETKAALGRANEALTKHLDSLKSKLTLPNGVKALLEEKDPVAQLSWLAENADSFTHGNDDPVPKPNEGRGRGVPPTPQPRKTGKPSETDKAAQAVSVKSYA